MASLSKSPARRRYGGPARRRYGGPALETRQGRSTPSSESYLREDMPE